MKEVRVVVVRSTDVNGIVLVVNTMEEVVKVNVKVVEGPGKVCVVTNLAEH